MTRMDKRTLLREVTRIVKANPNKVANCVYAKAGKPECVAGVWFANHGIDVTRIGDSTVEGLFGTIEHEPSDYDSTREKEAREAFKSFDVERMSPGAKRLLNFIQAVQDDRLNDAARTIVGGMSSFSNEAQAWVADAQKAIDYDGTHPTWSNALALTVANYDKF